jgi:hypothetical protein
MKSYFLEPILSREAGASALSKLLMGQQEPWVLWASKGDAIAYFNVSYRNEDNPNVWYIQADVSGRHHDRDEDVLSVLSTLKETIGGEITCEP